MSDTPTLWISVDRHSPVPLYYQVAVQLQQAIERGDLEPGHKLENEVALADQLGLSRPTMRRAIQELVSKGLLVRKAGVGTQVVPGRVRREVELTSLYNDLASSGPGRRCCATRWWRLPWSWRRRWGSSRGPRCCTWSGSAWPAIIRWRSCATGCPSPYSPPPTPNSRPTASTNSSAAGEPTCESPASGSAPAGRAHGRPTTSASPRVPPLLTMRRTSYDDRGRVVESGDHVYSAETCSFQVTLVER